MELTFISFVIITSCSVCYFVSSSTVQQEEVDKQDDAINNLKFKKKPMRVFTDEELSIYDGTKPGQPIYLAVKGVVFDVTTGGALYGKGAVNSALAGKDCTRALAMSSMSVQDLTSDVTGLSQDELYNLDKIFKEAFIDKYPIVGHMSFTAVEMNATPLYKNEL